MTKNRDYFSCEWTSWHAGTIICPFGKTPISISWIYAKTGQGYQVFFNSYYNLLKERILTLKQVHQKTKLLEDQNKQLEDGRNGRDGQMEKYKVELK